MSEEELVERAESAVVAANALQKKLDTAIYRLCVLEDSPNLNDGEKALVREWILDLRS